MSEGAEHRANKAGGVVAVSGSSCKRFRGALEKLKGAFWVNPEGSKPRVQAGWGAVWGVADVFLRPALHGRRLLLGRNVLEGVGKHANGKFVLVLLSKSAKEFRPIPGRIAGPDR